MSFQTLFEDFFFRQLPLYFKANDSYKNVDGEGLLERFLKVPGIELDNYIIPKAETYMEIRDANLTPDNLLPSLAKDLGSPPNLLIDPADFRKLLTYIVTFYKIKGTKEAYELFFAFLGYIVTIIEYPPADSRMDIGLLMDDGNLMDNACPVCSDYEIVLMLAGSECDPTVVPTYLDQDLIALINIIVSFAEPIHANLVGITTKVEACEDIDGCTDELITWTVTETIQMDSGFTFDGGITMDTVTVISTNDIEIPCGLGDNALLATETPDPLTQEQNDNSPIIV